MKTKKVILILIAIAFALVIILSGVGLFTIKKVQVDYKKVTDSVSSEKFNIDEIQEVLNDFNGKNMLFLKTETVSQKLKGYDYVEVTKVNKSLPNILDVEIRERREIYYMEHQDKVYILTEDGFVLNAIDKTAFSGNVSRDQIMFYCDDLDISDVRIGSIIKSEKYDCLGKAFEIAKNVNLTDCIKSISLKKIAGYDNVFDLQFETYTGVTICVQDILDAGITKAEKAFEVYDKYLNDFQKTFGTIESYVMNDGRFRVTYEDHFIM